MAFEPEVQVTPVDVIRTEITIIHQEGSDPILGPEVQAVRFVAYIKRSDGSTITRSGDLWPHLTTTQRNQLLAFDAAMWTKANAEFIPTPP